MSNKAAPRQILVEAANRLLNGLRARMATEAKQVACFKQLRVLNPRHLCDLSPHLRDTLELRLDIPGVQDAWAAYAKTTFCDFTGPSHLVERWNSRPSSALKDYVLFLITMVMGTGSICHILPPTTNRQLPPTTDCPPPSVANLHQLPTANCQPQLTTNRQWRLALSGGVAANDQPPTTSHCSTLFLWSCALPIS